MADPLFLLDTNVCIYLLGSAGHLVHARVEQCEEGQLAISTITVGEVMIGVRKLGAMAEAETFFSTVTICPFDIRAAMVYSQLPFRRGSHDRLIAAHAFDLDLTLVTDNERDFMGLPGLRIENWVRP